MSSLDDINTGWFRSAEETDEIKSTTLNSIDNLVALLDDFDSNVEGQFGSDINLKNILYEIIGYRPSATNDFPIRKTQEDWYSSFIRQHTDLSGQIYIILSFIKSHPLNNDLNSFLLHLNQISEYIIVRYFSNNIPSIYLNDNVTGNIKPLLVDRSSPNYSDMLPALHNFFNNSGQGFFGVGIPTIREFCIGISRDVVSTSIPIRNWCGCFCQEDPIATKIKNSGKYPESSSYNKECDPLCIHEDSIKLVSNYENKQCNSQICILSKVSLVNIDGSTGSINFNQNCPCNTSSNPCICIIDSSVQDILDKTHVEGKSMALTSTFSQYCPGARCMIEDADTKEITEVDCDNDNPNNTANLVRLRKENEKIDITTIFILIFILIIGILFILCARHIGYKPSFTITDINPNNLITKTTKSSDMGYFMN